MRGIASLVRTLALGLALLPATGACGGGGGRLEVVTGRVLAEGAAVAGATVRVQTTSRSTTTDAYGRFALDVSGLGPAPHRLTAWAPGFFCAGPFEAAPGTAAVVIRLHAHTTEDNADYAWLPSVPHAESGGAPGCSECHARVDEADPMLPVDEWVLDAHAGSVANARFLTMYLGTDVFGSASPPTRYVQHPDYGRVPLPPDPALPYYGPGYRLDFPDAAGNCACCHAPAAAVADPYGTDPTLLAGVASEGVPCDLCHKVWSVVLDPATGRPYDNRPGVLSLTFRRPPEGEQFFAGPLDDVAPGEDTRLPLQRESRFCAPCHSASFWGVRIYDSYGEWLGSPWSDPVTGRTCQDCHMPRGGATCFARPERGGLQRDPASIASHRMLGAADEALLQDALTLTLEAAWEGASVGVTVEVLNDRTGHKVPTDSPLRHVILLVEARAEDGSPLACVTGPRIPAWCGVGDPAAGEVGGEPGTAYALVLEELWTEVSPTGAYWNPTRVIADNRLDPFARDVTRYTFAAPSGAVTVTARLVFRRAFLALARQKGWDVPDVLMAEASLRLP